MSVFSRFLPQLTQLNLNTPAMRADSPGDLTGSNTPAGISLDDIQSMEQFLIGVRTHTGQVVTPEKAKRCTAVLACMRGISEDLAALPLKLFKRNAADGGDVEATDHNLYRILDSAPNDIMTSLEVRERILWDSMLWGNWYVLKNMEDGVINSLWPLQAGWVTRRWRETMWTFTDPLTGISGTFTPDMVWRGQVCSPNGLDGQALTLLAREAVGLALAAEEQAGRLFSYGVQSDLAIEVADGATLDKENKDQLREAFMQRHSGSKNAWVPLLLEGGLTAKRLGLTAQESQYMEARQFQIADIARIFRYPEVLLGSSGKGSKASTYASAEQFFSSYTKHTLIPWAVRIEQTIHRDLLTQKEQPKYYVRHDFSSLLRPDIAGRYAAYAIGIDKGFITPGYAARSEGLPWKPELEYYNKPAAGQDGADPDTRSAPTDQSAYARVAAHILRREYKAIIGQKQDADNFYSTIGAVIEELTGAPSASVLWYLETRRLSTDRFSDSEQNIATLNLISLCEGTI